RFANVSPWPFFTFFVFVTTIIVVPPILCTALLPLYDNDSHCQLSAIIKTVPQASFLAAGQSWIMLYFAVDSSGSCSETDFVTVKAPSFSSIVNVSPFWFLPIRKSSY